MKNIKKLILLFSIITVFGISCQNAQQSLNSSFDIVTDDPTSVPDNPPNKVTGSEELPDDFIISPKTFSSEDLAQGSWGVAHRVSITKGSKVKSYELTTQASFIEHTAGVADAKGILSSLELRPGPSTDQYVLSIKNTMFNSLGGKGHSAKIKLDVYINAKAELDKKFSTGIITLYVNVKRIR